MEQNAERTSRKEENKALRKYFQAEISGLAENIKVLREAYGESQTDLANVIHVGKSTICQYETGQRTPNLFMTMAIAHHYRLTVERLIYGNYYVKVLNDRLLLKDEEAHDSIPSNNKETNKIVWETILEIVDTDQAHENKYFREAYRYHCQLKDALIEGKGIADRYTIQKYQNLYKLAAEDGVLEAVVNLLWWPMCESISVSSMTSLLREKSAKYEKNTPARTILKETMMPTLNDSHDPEFDEAKSDILFKHRLEIYTLLRLLKKSNVQDFRDLADYYTALMYRFNFSTEMISPEESYAIGSELLTMGRIMENPYADRYLQEFDQFNYCYDDDDTNDPELVQK